MVWREYLGGGKHCGLWGNLSFSPSDYGLHMAVRSVESRIPVAEKRTHSYTYS